MQVYKYIYVYTYSLYISTAPSLRFLCCVFLYRAMYHICRNRPTILARL